MTRTTLSASIFLAALCALPGRASAEFITVFPRDFEAEAFSNGSNSPIYLANGNLVSNLREPIPFVSFVPLVSTSVGKFVLPRLPTGATIVSARLDFRLSDAFAFNVPETTLTVISGGSSRIDASQADFVRPSDFASPTTTSLLVTGGVRGTAPIYSIDQTALIRSIIGRSSALALKFELDAGRNASFAIDGAALTLEFARPAAVPEPSTLILSGIALLAATLTRACRANWPCRNPRSGP